MRPGCASDAPTLADFAARAFRDAYAHLIEPAEMQRLLLLQFGERQQAAELADPRAAYVLAEIEGRLAGYVLVRADRAPPIGEVAVPVELGRLYVDRRWHGRGIAPALMRAAIGAARRLGGRTLWLSVWQRNPRAAAFYRKCGFVTVGTASWDLAEDVVPDDIMALDLASAGAEPAG